MNSNGPLLSPVPKKISFSQGNCRLPRGGYIFLSGKETGLLLPCVDKLKSVLQGEWEMTASPAADPEKTVFKLIWDQELALHPQGYRLNITPGGLELRAPSPAGIFYGVCTIRQLLNQYKTGIPLLSIEDWPDFDSRGVMLDISRDKVPTLGTLMSLVDQLSEWKINQLQLYTEHTFAYLAHEEVWREASPLTGEDILLLDAYCKLNYMELVPNQNSFGHMERWLKHDRYKHLAEAPEGYDTPQSHIDRRTTLCPIDPGFIELIAGMYDELLPHFSSPLFNVGCDETWELGKGRSKPEAERIGEGRVYLDFLLKIYEQAQIHGKRMMFWGDIILHHPELIKELPKDIIAMDWGYEADHPFAAECEKFGESGMEFWVCPGTSSWNSLTGRTDNCIANLNNAALNGITAGANGFLNTDWGDNGHLQYLPVSYLGFFYGAAVSWNASGANTEILPDALSMQAFHDSMDVMGRMAYDLGNAYQLINRKRGNGTVIWEQLLRPLSDLSVAERISEVEFDRAQAVAEEALRDLKDAQMAVPDGELIRDEFANIARMAILACMLGKARLALIGSRDISGQKAEMREILRKIISEHERLWLARNKPGGLADSKQRLEARLAELE